MSVQRVTFLSLETKRSHTGPNLEKMVNGVAVRSPIWPIWSWRGRKCEPVRYHDGRALFFPPNGAVFSAIRPRTCPIIWHRQPCDRFALLQVVDVDHTLWVPKNGGHHLSGLWDSLRLLRSRFTGWSPLFRLFLGLWCVPVDLCFVDGHETTQKLLRIALKQRQTLLWSGLTVAFVVRSEQTRHPSRRQLSYAQNFMEDMTHVVFWHAYCLSYLAYLQSAVCQYEIVDFCQKKNVRPRWNSLNQFLSVATKEKSHRTQLPSALWFRCAACLPKTRMESQTDIALSPFF